MSKAATQTKRSDLPLAAVAVAIVLLVGVLAGGALWVVRGIHARVAHTDAARTVVQQGNRIAIELANNADLIAAENDTGAWQRLSRLFRTMHSVQEGLQYVSVVQGGVTVYHEQFSGVAEDAVDKHSNGNQAKVGRRLLNIGGEAIPVAVFSVPFATTNGLKGSVEVALRADAVGKEEHTAGTAVSSMFRLSIATVLVSFAVCAVVVVWTLRREAQRERQRREEEHLAFSGVMANGIAHDFRNPMSSMRLDIQMLQKEVLKAEASGERIKGLTDRIRQTLDRMDKVFQEFLYLSRPSTEASEPVDVAACVRESVSMLSPRFDAAGVRVEPSIAGPIHVVAFAGSLRRALVNVLINAEQFSGQGGSVSVSVARDGREAVVDIRDSGPGIPKADMKRVFDMFVTGRPGGTGLGLFLARAAVERCGGTILAKDHTGRGAWVQIRLPLAEEDKRTT